MLGGTGRYGQRHDSEFRDRTVLEEVMPQVEKAYNATKDRNQRAIAGLSMGGAEALYTGLNHRDRFAGRPVQRRLCHVASRDCGTGGDPRRPGGDTGSGPRTWRGRGRSRGRPVHDARRLRAEFPELMKANSQIRLLWIACGVDDGLNTVNCDFKDWSNPRTSSSRTWRFPASRTSGRCGGGTWPSWRPCCSRRIEGRGWFAHVRVGLYSRRRAGGSRVIRRPAGSRRSGSKSTASLYPAQHRVAAG